MTPWATAPPRIRVSICWRASSSKSRRTVAADTPSAFAALLDLELAVRREQFQQLVPPAIPAHRHLPITSAAGGPTSGRRSQVAPAPSSRTTSAIAPVAASSTISGSAPDPARGEDLVQLGRHVDLRHPRADRRGQAGVGDPGRAVQHQRHADRAGGSRRSGPGPAPRRGSASRASCRPRRPARPPRSPRRTRPPRPAGSGRRGACTPSLPPISPSSASTQMPRSWHHRVTSAVACDVLRVGQRRRVVHDRAAGPARPRRAPGPRRWRGPGAPRPARPPSPRWPGRPRAIGSSAPW